MRRGTDRTQSSARRDTQRACCWRKIAEEEQVQNTTEGVQVRGRARPVGERFWRCAPRRWPDVRAPWRCAYRGAILSPTEAAFERRRHLAEEATQTSVHEHGRRVGAEPSALANGVREHDCCRADAQMHHAVRMEVLDTVQALLCGPGDPADKCRDRRRRDRHRRDGEPLYKADASMNPVVLFPEQVEVAIVLKKRNHALC
mmetsp:Transcript_109483/g.308904  ORF Transcript_109483/g.308904 Transcript_109483/m.308904 type:complete len:201 (-) Transcript_109483:260-862(-)